MKYLLLTFLLLSGCASKDYIQGCYDGLDMLITKQEYNSSQYRQETDQQNAWAESQKRQICQDLQDKRNQRLERAYPKNR